MLGAFEKARTAASASLQAVIFCSSSSRLVSSMTLTGAGAAASTTAAMSACTVLCAPSRMLPTLSTMSISAAPFATASAASCAFDALRQSQPAEPAAMLVTLAPVGISACGYQRVDISVWISACGYQRVDISVWISACGYQLRHAAISCAIQRPPWWESAPKSAKILGVILPIQRLEGVTHVVMAPSGNPTTQMGLVGTPASSDAHLDTWQPLTQTVAAK
eukprot:SAG11_NODE_2225_length_3663_cov_4.668911_2_plen_220_part_00